MNEKRVEVSIVMRGIFDADSPMYTERMTSQVRHVLDMMAHDFALEHGKRDRAVIIGPTDDPEIKARMVVEVL